ncbi:type II toxin-antitoxin system RelE/ParE family toxin [Bremerella sp. JC770]|uniref:type II toxin-antitoxin system RelE/ParE family toxin n=1 Tax=Bremerella sp. JC770 TaxID=3232137 RepID=UPI00345802D2
MMYSVAISRSAELDIHQAFHWWHENRSPDQAFRWYHQIVEAVETLEHMPERCPLAAEAQSIGVPVRQLLFGVGKGPATHRILFTIVNNGVRVLRVLHVSMAPLTKPSDLAQ